MRPCLSLTLALTMLLAAPSRAAEPEPSSRFRLKWAHGSLSGQWTRGKPLLEVGREELSEAHFLAWETELLSAVGPLVSVREASQRYTADSGNLRYTERIVVRSINGDAPDLAGHLARTRQGASVAQQWRLALPETMVDAGRCSAANGSTERAGALSFHVGQLIGSGCVKLPAMGPRSDIGALIDRPLTFAIDHYDPASGVATLSIAWSDCESRPLCDAVSFQARVRPPKAWIPWLEAARRGEGVLGDHRPWRLFGVRDPGALDRLSRMFADGGPISVATLEEPGRLVAAGIDDAPNLRVGFSIRSHVRPPSDDAHAFFPDARPGGVVRFDALSWAFDAPRPSKAELRKSWPQLFRRGGRYLITYRFAAERQYPGDAVRIPASLERFLDAHGDPYATRQGH